VAESGEFMLDKTYQIEAPPEPAMKWDSYEQLIMAEWDQLLNVDSPAEKDVQAFLERHPSMLPGAFNLLGGESGHYPWLCGVISQPPLPSYNSRIPDFMWLSLNSDTEEPVLIEIEAPSKRWFTESGIQTAQLTQALDQIAEWKAWFGVTHNVQAFKAFYRLDSEAWRRRRFRPSYLLIYGRRAEANASPRLTEKRTFLHADDVVVMTYDRLRPNPNANQLVCMRPRKDGFKVVAVPPTLKWRPGLAKDRALLRGLGRAIEANSHIPPSRKDFLVRRLAYWNEWANRDERGVINSFDEE